jgi:hypothetical protein
MHILREMVAHWPIKLPMVRQMMRTFLEKTQNAWRLRMAILFDVLLMAGILSSALPRGAGFCIFKTVTGIPCPVCGLTHSINSFLAGNTAESVRYHACGPLASIICIAFAGYFSVVSFTDSLRHIDWETEQNAFTWINRIIFSVILLIWLVHILKQDGG